MSLKASLIIALLCSSFCNAEVIRNQRGGYSFVFPPGWSLDRAPKDFTVVSPNKVELSELPTPPPPTQSLEQVTQFSVMAFTALWGANSTDQAFDLSGKKWKGRAVVLDVPSQPKKPPSQAVIFVAKSGKEFRQFYFSVPVEDWKNNSQQYLAILSTMRFPDLW